MPADRREFIRLDVNYIDNPKVADVLETSPLAVVLHVEAMCFSRRNRTDGVVPIDRLARKVGATQEDVATLLSRGLLDRLDDGRIAVHDYLRHQETAEQIAKLSEAGRKAGKRSGDVRRERAAATDRSTDRSTNRSTNRSTEGEERERREEKEPTAPSVRATRTQAAADTTLLLLSGHGLDNADRDAFLAHLAAAGVRSPSVLVSRLHQSGDLRRRIEQWRIDTKAATTARATPSGKRTTDDRVRDGLALAQRLADEDGDATPRQIGARA